MVMRSTGASEKNFFFSNWKIIVGPFSCSLLSVKCSELGFLLTPSSC